MTDVFSRNRKNEDRQARLEKEMRAEQAARDRARQVHAEWVERAAKSHAKTYTFVPLSQISAVVEKLGSDPDHVHNELKKLNEEARFRQNYQVSDDELLVWMNNYPSLEQTEIISVLAQNIGEKERNAEFKRLVKQQEKQRFEAVAQAVEAQQKKNKNNNDDDDQTTTSTTDYVTEYYESPHFSQSISSTSFASPTSATIAASISNNNKDNDAVHASVWQGASERRRERMLNHYCEEYKRLTREGIQRILEHTLDLPAAQREMERASNGAPPTFLANDKRARVATLTRAIGEQPAIMRAITAPRATTTENRSASTDSPNAALEFEISFFADMFDYKIPISKIVEVLAKETETESRIAVFSGIVAEFEGRNSETTTEQRKGAFGQTEIVRAVRRLEALTTAVESYRIMFPKLTRHDLVDAIENSSDPVAAMVRMTERKEQESLVQVPATTTTPSPSAPPPQQQQQQDFKDEDFVDIVCDENGNPTTTTSVSNLLKKQEQQQPQQQQPKEHRECLICLCETRTVAAIPCGHTVCCEGCKKKFEESPTNNKCCLVCRKKYVGLFRIYE